MARWDNVRLRRFLVRCLVLVAVCRGAGVALAQGIAQGGTPQGLPETMEQRLQRAQRVDVMFTLDCSGSMWVVHDESRRSMLSVLKQIVEGPREPRVRAGLILYGDPGEYRVFPLSPDLDGFALLLQRAQTSPWGSEERPLRFIAMATSSTSPNCGWNDPDQGYKPRPEDALGAGSVARLIWAVGNEPLRQGGDIDLEGVIASLVKRGFFLSVIDCDFASQETDEWKRAAELGRGAYLRLVPKGSTPSAVQRGLTPFDSTLNDLNQQLNATYLPYGPNGLAGQRNFSVADFAAAQAGGDVFLARLAQKIAPNFDQSAWDMVDALRPAGFQVPQTLGADKMPTMLAALSPEQITLQLRQLSTTRAALREQIRRLLLMRRLWLSRYVTARFARAAQAQAAQAQAEAAAAAAQAMAPSLDAPQAPDALAPPAQARASEAQPVAGAAGGLRGSSENQSRSGLARSNSRKASDTSATVAASTWASASTPEETPEAEEAEDAAVKALSPEQRRAIVGGTEEGEKILQALGDEERGRVLLWLKAEPALRRLAEQKSAEEADQQKLWATAAPAAATETKPTALEQALRAASEAKRGELKVRVRFNIEGAAGRLSHTQLEALKNAGLDVDSDDAKGIVDGVLDWHKLKALLRERLVRRAGLAAGGEASASLQHSPQAGTK